MSAAAQLMAVPFRTASPWQRDWHQAGMMAFRRIDAGCRNIGKRGSASALAKTYQALLERARWQVKKGLGPRVKAADLDRLVTRVCRWGKKGKALTRTRQVYMALLGKFQLAICGYGWVEPRCVSEVLALAENEKGFVLAKCPLAARIADSSRSGPPKTGKDLRVLAAPQPRDPLGRFFRMGGHRPPETLWASEALNFPAPQAPSPSGPKQLPAAAAAALRATKRPASANVAAVSKPDAIQEAVMEQILASLQLSPEEAHKHRRARKGLAPQTVFRPDSGAWRLHGHRLEVSCLKRLGITPQIYEAARKKIGVWDPRGRQARRRFLAYAASIARKGLTAKAHDDTAEFAGMTWDQRLAE